MTGAVATASPAATAAGNATILSGPTGDPPAADPNPPAPPPAPPPGAPPTDPPREPEPGPGPDGAPDPAEPAQDGDGGDGEPKGAPEQYAFTAPDGVPLDPAAVEAFAPVAKDLGLTQEQAQRVVDLYAGLQARQAQAQADQAERWAEQVRDDPEIGGPRMVEQVEAANAALRRFSTPALADLLKATGLCNHPEMVRAWAHVGKAIADDAHVAGGHPGPEPRSAESFYARMAR